MQTFANLSRSSDCYLHIEINNDSLNALKLYLTRYRVVTKYHLSKRFRDFPLRSDMSVFERPTRDFKESEIFNYLGHTFESPQAHRSMMPSSSISEQSPSLVSLPDLLTKRRIAPNLLYLDQMIVEARHAVEKSATSPFEKNVM